MQLAYDNLSRIITETPGDPTLDAEAVTVAYPWDASSNLTQIDYPSGFEAQRTYDAINRLTAIEDGSSNAIEDFDL